MSMSEDSKQKAWLGHYQRLLIVEFDEPPVKGPPFPITTDMVKKAISQMKVGKAPGPSGIVVEMIRAAGDMGASMIRDLTAAIIHNGKVPSDWEQSFTVCLYKGKGGALERSNYWGIKLTEQVMKALEDGLIRQLFPVWLRPRQRHNRRNLCNQAAAREVSSCQQDTLHGFHRPGEGFWLSISEGQLDGGHWENLVWRSLCDWCRCMPMQSCVRVGKAYSEEFEVKAGVHQGSVLSPLLFIIVLEALSWEFSSGVPWEDLYADDLVIIAESLEECVKRLLTWKEEMEKKGLKLNAGKTKIKICGAGLDLLQSLGEFPCAVCRTGVGSNSIFCNGCKHLVHKKCSGPKRLTKDPD